MGDNNYGGDKNHDPSSGLQGQLQGELQGQGQLEGQGELQGQSQSSFDANGNLNGNANFDANGNSNANCDTNHNTNDNCDTVSVDVSVCANITPLIGDTCDGAVLYMPETINQTIGGNGEVGGGTNTEIALDQVNSLVSNGSADHISDSNSGGSFSGSETGGVTNDGNGAFGAVGDGSTESAQSTITSAVNGLDALNQSIVMGANIQNNSFSTTVVGHDAITATDSHVHT
jgi:hypothetical protein